MKLHDNWELQLSVRSGDVIMCILQFVTKLILSNLQLLTPSYQEYQIFELQVEEIRLEIIEMNR